MQDSAVETRGKARQGHEDAPKRGRPKKAENKEIPHDEYVSDEHMEEGGSNAEVEEPKSQSHTHNLRGRSRKAENKEAHHDQSVPEENVKEAGDNAEEEKTKSQPQKRGRPRKAENKEDHHNESDEDEHTNGEEEKPKKTRQLNEDIMDEDMNGTEHVRTAEEFGDFIQQLQANVSVEEISALLQENGLDTLGSEEELYQRSADLLFFGTCQSCSSCGGVLEYSGQTYRCSSYSTEWAKCNYSTQEGRKGGKAKVPTKLKSDFLKKWVKSHAIVQNRQFDPENKPFSGMTFVMAGRMSRNQGEVKEMIEMYGGRVVGTVREGVTAILTSDQEVQGGGSSKLSDANELGLPICRESWLTDSIEEMKAQPLSAYNMVNLDETPWDQRAPEDEAAEAVTADLKMWGKRAVYKDTHLEEEGGKIYENDGIIYSCTFSMCDIFIDLNQYAVLQLIEVEAPKKRRGPHKANFYLYVKEGRVGDRRGVRERLDKQESSRVAVREFTEVFEQLTGNNFLEWEREKKVSKHRNKYYPIDMRVGVDARAGALEPKQLGIAAAHCSEVDSRVVEFLKVLFSQTTYRYAMTEIGVDAPDLPNGNLSDWHIDLCQKYLVEFSEYLKKAEDNEQKKEQMCLDFSNKWFTLLHSTRPFIFNDLVQLAELAAPTFETVRDISCASTIIGDMNADTMNNSFRSIADRYTKLDCVMTPLDREGEDYSMILNYFNKTMETLKFAGAEYGLNIEDIVQLESKAGPSMDDILKVHNRMLLWSGMRTSNLIANLHRGLLPAPIEAAAPSYSFGKGIYFTDAAVKAAQYGFTAVDRAEGFLLLSIVGLESRPEMPYPDKPVEEYEEAKACVKINGKRGPEQTEYIQWKHEVTVPCGTLKDTNVEGVKDFMDYNEYVSYDPKKVKPMFLVKTRFEETTPTSKLPVAQ